MITDKRTLVVVIIIAILVAGFLLWKYKLSSTTPSSQIPAISPVDVNKDISNKVVNPTLPQTNPFSAKTNPYSGIYKNPFSK